MSVASLSFGALTFHWENVFWCCFSFYLTFYCRRKMELNSSNRELHQTRIPGSIITYIANYTNRRKTYTTYRNHTSIKRQLKTDVTQGGVLSPTLFNIYTADLPPPRAPVQVMSYADDIKITSTHKLECNEELHKTIYTYSLCLDKTSHIKSGPNNLYSVHSRPCAI